ncbi:MAG: hypothetical protein IT178_16530 [Acidobacteria bacterium]|nr:hypothetical protein [Acidobacteriota bacterium]
MGTLVQSSTAVEFFGDASSKNLSLTGVTSGNSILVAVSLAVYTSTEPVISVSDGTSYQNDYEVWFNPATERKKVALFRLHGVSSGSKTITVSFTGPSSANVYGAMRAYEVSGLANSAPDKTMSATGTSTTPATPSSGTLTQANNFVIGAMMSEKAGIDLPSGFTNLYLDDSTSAVPPNSHDYKNVSSTSSLSVAWGTLSSSGDWAAVAAVYKDASSVSVTDVDTDETITADQTNVVVTGTGFGSSQGAGTVTIRQGSTSVAQTIDSWFDTSIQFDVVFDSTTDLKYGAATLRVTNDDADFGEIAITINPPSGTVYANLSTPNTTSAYRISASGDLVAGDQLRARGVGATAFPAGHTLNADATVTVAPATAAVDIEVSAWDASDSTWGAYATQSLATYPVGVTDAASVSVSDSGGVEIAGITEKAGTETASISLTESAAVLVAVGVTDTVTLAVTDVSDVDAVLVDKAVTDTASISIADFASVNIVGTVSKTGADAASITVTDTATVQQAPRILSVDISLSEARTDITLS